MITLYKLRKLRPEENMLIENMEAFLNETPAQDVLSYEDFTYIKNELAVTVTIPVQDASIETDKNPWTYVRIQNNAPTTTEEFEPIFYYYVVSTEWISAKAVRLHLMMDTLNSLCQTGSPINPHNLSPETRIYRQHQDRFKRPDYFHPAFGGELTRVVDRLSEGISFNQDKSLDMPIIVPPKALDWYLIYTTEVGEEQAISNPIATYLCASEPLKVSVTNRGTAQTFTASNIQANTIYRIEMQETDTIVSFDDPEDGNITISSDTPVVTSVSSNGRVKRGGFIRVVEFQKVNNGLQVRLTSNDATTVHFNKPNLDNYFDDIDTPKWTGVISLTINQGKYYYVNNAQTEITGGTYVESGIAGIEYLNRADSRLIKVIKLPYCPVEYERLAGNIYKFPGSWSIPADTDAFKSFLRYFGTSLPTFINDTLPPIDISKEMIYNVPPSEDRYTDAKQIDAESKLYHSDYHIVKVYYDNFETTIDCERFGDILETDVPVEFKVTSTINSKFGFRIGIDDIGNYFHNEDFDNYLMVSRNNEETLMNSEYVNYINNGYNYDKKANALAMKQAARNAVLSTIGSAFNIGTAAASLGQRKQVNTRSGYFTNLLNPASWQGSNVYKAIGATSAASASCYSGLTSVTALGQLGNAASAASTAVGAWINLAELKQAQDNAMAQKLAQLSAQAASTAGSDDVDLMSWYSDNRLHVARYEVPNFVRKSLYHAFDLTGYAQEKYGIPDVDSRLWYNFIQCDPIFLEQGYDKYKQTWLDDVRAKYQSGVTVFHNRNGAFDLEQQYENWETWIVSGIDY